MARMLLVVYWLVTLVAVVWAYFAGYPSLGAYLTLAVGLPWNIVLGVILLGGTLALSLALEAVGAGRIDLSSTTGEQQLLFLAIVGALFGAMVNSLVVRSFARRRAARESAHRST